MNYRHPYRWLPSSIRGPVFLILLLLALGLMVVLQVIDVPLRTSASPSGIISFELAGTSSAAERILQAWGTQGLAYAGLSLGLDYLFMFGYAGCIGLGCAIVAEGAGRGRAGIARSGIVLGWAMLLALLLDATENLALIRILIGSPPGMWPLVARWCAVPKFIIVAAGLMYVLVGLPLLWVLRGRGARGAIRGN